MTADTDFAISEGSYTWFTRAFQMLKNYLGLNIKVHNDNGTIESGHIFLFNHFARFETIIPPYIFYEATGAYTRSIADHHLFELSPGFAKLLRGVGAVPNNLPGLLPFLAAEILRGRKVVVFPEGGMVKDRRVVDEAGEFGVYSRKTQERRKHHLGAAVLAVTLDVFKRRILDVFQSGDMDRVYRWVQALGVDSATTLHARASEPTLVVPGNITFYPLRVNDNAISRAAQMLSKDLPKQITEELVVEGNLLLRDTDMDIRFGAPLQLNKKWRWWERTILDKYFMSVTSLPEFFGLREHSAGSWSEKMLARCLAAEAAQLRDRVTDGMYRGLTVNLSHVASWLITRMVARDVREIAADALHKAFYLSLKSLQLVPSVHLHRSLSWPDRYRGLVDGECAELMQFLGVCKDAGLIGRTGKTYRFLDVLRQAQEFDQVRLENPVVVYANELAPIRAAVDAIGAVGDRIQTIADTEVAAHLFDDELRSYAWNHAHYAQPQFAEINARETATQSGAPYLLRPHPAGTASTGILLVHGFLASPAELRAFGDELHAQGHAVLGARITGHGTSPWDLRGRTWQQWLASIRRSYRILSALADRIVIVGFSTGGVLALMVASERPAKLAGVAAVCSPLTYRDRKMALASLMHGLNKVSDWLPSFDGPMPFRPNPSEHPDINYASIPISGLHELRSMRGEFKERLRNVTAPTLIVQADEDPVVYPGSATVIFKNLASEDKHLHWVKAKRHGLLNEDLDGTCAALKAFIDRVAVRSAYPAKVTG